MSWKNLAAVLSPLLFLSYAVFFTSIICSSRAVSSITIAAILLFSLLKSKAETGRFFSNRINILFITGCFTFYALQVIGLLYTQNLPQGFWHLQIKSALLFIPLIFCCYNYFTRLNTNSLLQLYVYILLACTLYCFFIAAKNYFYVDHDAANFIYHKLVSPFEHHAVQFSLLVFIAIAYMLYSARKGTYIKNVYVHFLLVAYFILFLLLLASKLVISYTILYLLYYLTSSLRLPGIKRLPVIIVITMCIALIGVGITTKNPVSNRFNEIINGDIGMVQNENYNPANYFNGLQFRLLQWRIVAEILTEKNAWLTGVSPGNVQQVMNEKYKSLKMYTGESGNNGGFLGYNTHNQLLESALQTGVIGLAAFLLICLGMIQMARRAKSSFYSSIIILLLANVLIESVFETQYGLVIYTFFPLFLYQFIKSPAS